MHFSQMIACEADQYTDTEFLSAMNDVITMETSYVLEASYSISTFFSRIWRLISGIFNFIYKAIAAAISFIRVKILGRPANREVTIRPVSTDNDGKTITKQITNVASAIYHSTDMVSVPINYEIFKNEYKNSFVHIDGVEDHVRVFYFENFFEVLSDFLKDIYFNYNTLKDSRFKESFFEYCKRCQEWFPLETILNTQPDKLIYTEAITECKCPRTELDEYWSKIDLALYTFQKLITDKIDKKSNKFKALLDEKKDFIDFVKKEVPGFLDDFLEFIKIASLHINQIKSVMAEISKVVISNTNIFKR